MVRKIVMLAVAMAAVAGVRAQIGYKSQLLLEAGAGLTHVEGVAGTVRLGGFLSEHSLLGVGVMYDRTTYDATQDDSFATSQWFGELHYRYALPLNRFILMPGGGLLLGAERCDALSKQGNLLPYGNQFVYGVSAGVSAEYILGRHWALAVEPRLCYLIRTHFDNLKLSANVGIKYYF